MPDLASQYPDMSADLIVLTAPDLQDIPAEDCPSSNLLKQACAAIATRTLNEALRDRAIPAVWKPLIGYLYRWMDRRCDMPHTHSSRTSQQVLSDTSPLPQAPLYELTSDPRGLYPGALLVASDADRVENGVAFIDFVVSVRGHRSIPDLLLAAERSKDWSDLADELFGVPLEEAERRFAAYRHLASNE